MTTKRGARRSRPAAATATATMGVIALIGVVINAMIGGGVFSLPQNLAAEASAGGIMIAWVITGIGIWFLATTFRILAAARPELTNGIYAYAETGFGRLIGFLSAYGYWICNCFALVAYSILIMQTVDLFLPYFEGGNNPAAIAAGSVIVWAMFALTLTGARQTGILNVLAAIGTLAPVAIFIVAVAAAFKIGTFLTAFWGTSADGSPLEFSIGSILPQVDGTMLIILWLFIGIEGAVVVSRTAASQRAVRSATTIGLLVTLSVYILASLLPFGAYSQKQLAAMPNPSSAQIMADTVGAWGEWVTNAGLIVSVLGSWFVWMVMLGEMPLAAARSGTFPKRFERLSSRNVPVFSLAVTAAIIQVILVCSAFSTDAWVVMISITSVMALPCYLFCTLFLVKIVREGRYPSKLFASKGYALTTGILGTLYGVWLVYAAGLQYLLLAGVVYALGLPLYVFSRRRAVKGRAVFGRGDWWTVAVVLAIGVSGAVYGVFQLIAR